MKVIYGVTPRDVREAIQLANLMGSQPTGSLWCGDGTPPEKFGGAPCGHTDDWHCAAAALGISPEAVALLIRTANDVSAAWAAEREDRDAIGIDVLAPRHVETLFDEDLEAECLLREGWIPDGYRVVRRHPANRGEYISLHWEDKVDAWYVRGHVEAVEFRAALVNWHGEKFFDDKTFRIRHSHAFWAFEGSDGYGNPNRTLRECGGEARGCFAITVMDADPILPASPPRLLTDAEIDKVFAEAPATIREVQESLRGVVTP